MEIDQSGRVEDLTMATVVAASNGIRKAIFISPGEKRIIVRFLKSRAPYLYNFAPYFFAALIFLLLKDGNFYQILIDEEYTGKESLIDEKLMGWFTGNGLRKPNIAFGRIGKHSAAHALAIWTHRSKGKSGNVKRIKAKQVLELFKIKQAGSKRRTHRVSR